MPIRRAMDWQLAYERSEMLRIFQADLLLNVAHQLRSPPTRQLSALTLVLEDWCETEQQKQTYLLGLRESILEWLDVWDQVQETLARSYPIHAITPQSVSLGSLFSTLEGLTRLCAEDRRMTYTLPDTLTLRHVTVWGDGEALLQALLGIFAWGLGQLISGSIGVSVTSMADQIELHWRWQGSLSPQSQPTLYWTVPNKLLAAMGGSLQQWRDEEHNTLTVTIQIPSDPGDSN
ncbi:MAG: hypothetical protein OHK0012_13420 [Synechococcales cyanobacterium]